MVDPCCGAGDLLLIAQRGGAAYAAHWNTHQHQPKAARASKGDDSLERIDPRPTGVSGFGLCRLCTLVVSSLPHPHAHSAPVAADADVTCADHNGPRTAEICSVGATGAVKY